MGEKFTFEKRDISSKRTYPGRFGRNTGVAENASQVLFSGFSFNSSIRHCMLEMKSLTTRYDNSLMNQNELYDLFGKPTPLFKMFLHAEIITVFLHNYQHGLRLCKKQTDMLSGLMKLNEKFRKRDSGGGNWSRSSLIKHDFGI